MRSVHIIGVALLGLPLAWLVACASSQGEAEPEVRTGLSDLMDPDAPSPELPVPPAVVAERPMTEEELWSQAAIDLERVLASTAAPTEPSATAAMNDETSIASTPGATETMPEVLADASLSALNDPTLQEPADQGTGWLLSRALDPARAMIADALPKVTALAAVFDPDRNPELARALEAPIDPSIRADLAATDLAQSLRELSAAEDGFRWRVILAAIEGAGLIHADPATADAATLTLEQTAALTAVNQLVRSLTSDAGTSAAMLDRFQEAANSVGVEQTVRIPYATVCRRVMGFGRYTPFENDRFIAGRPQKMIVYVEVDRFAHRALAESLTGDRWSVDLEQELILHDEGGSIAWQVPAQEVREPSRSRRHDFYLIHEIELPARLAPGSYRLKVVMRDLVANARAEAVIPIRLVASGR